MTVSDNFLCSILGTWGRLRCKTVRPRKPVLVLLLIHLALGTLCQGVCAKWKPRLLSSSVYSQDSRGLAMEERLVLRLTGPGFVPFTLKSQQAVLQALREELVPAQGPVTMLSYREGYPDPAAPANMTEKFPYVDVAGKAYDMLENATSFFTWQPDAQALLTFISRMLQLGNFSRDTHSVRLLSWAAEEVTLNSTVVLRPLVVLEAALDVQLADASGDLLAEQATAVAIAVDDITSDFSTRTEVRSSNSSWIQGVLDPPGAQANTTSGSLLLLEVTVYACGDGTNSSQGNGSSVGNSTALATPQCEIELLQQRLEQLPQSRLAAAAWEPAGVAGASVVQVRQRPVPSPPAGYNATAPRNATNAAGAPGWVPWTLDRIDQRNLPLNGQFTANATGTGVNIYLISSGINADHQEFQYLHGTGTRIRPGWGYNGLAPLEDCDDSFLWYGFGTFAASVAGGLRLGAAKNATITSVRFRGSCLVDEPGTFSPDGLPAAIDSIVSNHTKPAVILIDAWWSRARFFYDDDEAVEKALKDKLDACQAANITVIAGAGPMPCENVISRHPASISVGSSDQFDGGAAGRQCTASCLDLWAPVGGLGKGMTGAHPTGPYDYRTVLPTLEGGSYIAAGVAAQYLELHPEASPLEVKAALLAMATPHIVTSRYEAPTAVNSSSSPNATFTPAAYNCTTRLLFTNLTEFSSWAPEPPVVPGGDSGAGSGSGAADSGGGGGVNPAAIAVPVVAAVAIVGALWVFMARRRRRRAVRQPTVAGKHLPLLPPLPGAEWELSEDQIEICKRPDGRPWLLGEGSYGQVFRAIKGGVQVVAVKQLRGRGSIQGARREQFIQEITLMKYVSRDANITQFYGAVMGPRLMLVAEYMEGGDLRNALTADRADELGWYRAGKGIALDILRGLTFLHDSHVIHRDIKSKNILLTREGRAKISDVGLAQALEEGEYQADGFVGTWAWAAPELVLGEHDITEKADIFSFGVVLWELATQEVPLRGCLHDPRVPEQCPQQVVDAIQDCLKRDPATRPTARELYSRLVAAPPAGDGHGASRAASLAAPSSTPGGGTPLALPSTLSPSTSGLNLPSTSVSSGSYGQRSAHSSGGGLFGSLGSGRRASGSPFAFAVATPPPAAVVGGRGKGAGKGWRGRLFDSGWSWGSGGTSRSGGTAASLAGSGAKPGSGVPLAGSGGGAGGPPATDGTPAAAAAAEEGRAAGEAGPAVGSCTPDPLTDQPNTVNPALQAVLDQMRTRRDQGAQPTAGSEPL